MPPKRKLPASWSKIGSEKRERTQEDNQKANLAQYLSGKGLLGLPGEVRNVIYSFAMEQDTVEIFLRKTAGAEDRNPDVVQRQFFGLTQVCRQIRLEYQVWYAKNTEIYIDIWDLPAYTKTFVDATLAGSIVLKYHSLLDPRAQGADLLPLIKLLAKADPTCLTASFENVRERLMFCVELSFLLSNDDSAWISSLDELERIELHADPLPDSADRYCPWCGEPHELASYIKFIFKLGHRIDWFRNCTGTTQAIQDEQEDWLASMGFGEITDNLWVLFAAERRRSERLLKAGKVDYVEKEETDFE